MNEAAAVVAAAATSRHGVLPCRPPPKLRNLGGGRTATPFICNSPESTCHAPLLRLVNCHHWSSKLVLSNKLGVKCGEPRLPIYLHNLAATSSPMTLPTEGNLMHFQNIPTPEPQSSCETCNSLLPATIGM